MRRWKSLLISAGASLVLALALSLAVPANAWPPSDWLHFATDESGNDADNAVLAPVSSCTDVDTPYTGCTGSGTGTFQDFPENYAIDPGRARDLSYQVNFTCTSCDGSNSVTATLQCTNDEVKWKDLKALFTAVTTDQDIGPTAIRNDDEAGDVTTGDSVCYKYRIRFTAAAGAPEIEDLNVTYFARTGAGL